MILKKKPLREVKQSGKEKQKLMLQSKVMESPRRKVANVFLPSKCYIISL
jgi:hypothetical protein